MAIVGTTYYWLDDRPQIFTPLWILGGILWYIAIIAAIIFVKNKTRLGFLLGGVLSWITLGFWLFDNFYVISAAPLIIDKPNDWVTIRNFVWAAISALAVISSHNTFHKIIDYQFKGKPI